MDSAEPPVEDMEGCVLNGTKLFRLESTLDGVLRELRSLRLDDTETAELAGILSRLLVEVGSCLPDPLLDELHRLIGPLGSAETGADTLRVIVAQLDGWLTGLISDVIAAASAGQWQMPAH